MFTRRTLLQAPLALSAASRLFAAVPTRHVKVETIFKSPGPAPNGLQATADGLWVLDQRDNHAYLVGYEKGEIRRKLKTDSVSGSGITFDGKALWLASTYSREIIQCDAQSGATLKRFPSPGVGVVSWKPSEARRSPLQPPPPPPDPNAAKKPAGPGTPTGAHGLEWRDGKLWISNPPSKTVYRMNPPNAQIEFQFPTVFNRPHGLGWDGDFLWCADSNLNAFHKHDPKTGKLIEQIQLADSDPQPHGMSIWQGWMWYCDEAGVICRLKL